MSRVVGPLAQITLLDYKLIKESGLRWIEVFVFTNFEIYENCNTSLGDGKETFVYNGRDGNPKVYEFIDLSAEVQDRSQKSVQ